MQKLLIFSKNFFTPFVENFILWFFIVVENDREISPKLFWGELEFFSPSSTNPVDFFDWYEEMGN